MNDVKSDLSKNRVYITIEGFLSEKEAKETADNVIQHVSKLKPGFAVITNIANMNAATAKASGEIARAQQFIKEKGVGRIIRVIKDIVTKNQFDRIGRSVGYEKEADTASTILEAESMLDLEITK